MRRNNKPLEFPPIPSKLLFSMGEACDLVGVASHVLRYWERETNHPSPVRKSGRRYYRCADILVARRIRTLLAEGMTLPGVVRQLGRDTGGPVAAESQLAQHMQRELREIIADLKTVEAG